jgi:hypothetical protein|tara:strand:+ start:80 stop:292 length:213 start_codon:yes stop_codon:yes gene_type:complete
MRRINAIESLLMMFIMPSIPMQIVGLTWLLTFGGFDFLLVVRSIPMILLVGVLSLLGVIAGVSNFSDSLD